MHGHRTARPALGCCFYARDVLVGVKAPRGVSNNVKYKNFIGRRKIMFYIYIIISKSVCTYISTHKMSVTYLRCYPVKTFVIF